MRVAATRCGAGAVLLGILAVAAAVPTTTGDPAPLPSNSPLCGVGGEDEFDFFTYRMFWCALEFRSALG